MQLRLSVGREPRRIAGLVRVQQHGLVAILYQKSLTGTFTPRVSDTLSRVQADSLVARKAEEADGKFDISDLPSLRDGMFIGGKPYGR